MKLNHKRALAAGAYFLVAAVVGCLVVPVSTYGADRGFIFGVLMAAVVWLAGAIDGKAHFLLSRTKLTLDLHEQLTAVVLLYVLMPAGVAALLHVLVPGLVVLPSGWQMTIGLIWMPLCLASLLSLKQRIK